MHRHIIQMNINKKLALYKELILYSILALITIIVYLPTLAYPFQFDDLPNILNYTKIKTAALSSLCFTHSRWVCTLLNTFLYQTCASNPFICRLINISFHTAAGAIIFWLILKFKTKLNQIYLASLTAVLFLLHPVQTQTISYVIQGQLEGLASLFMLICIASFYNYTQAKNQTTSYIWIILLFVSLIAATSTKEIAIVIPFLILLVDWFWIARGNLQKIKRLLWIHLLTFATTIGMYLYYLKAEFFISIISGQQVAQSSTGNLLTNTGIEAISQYQFLISQFKVIIHYLWIFIWPFNICVEYDWQLNNSFLSTDCILPFMILVLILVTIFYLLRKNKTDPIAFGMLWFLICILPRASFIASSELLVDYKTYLASFGWLFVISYLLIKMANQLIKPKNQTNVLFGLVSLLIITLSTLTYYRNTVWSSTKLFWGDVILKAPTKTRGFNNYGMALVEDGEYQKSIFYFKRAISLNKSKNINTFYWDPYKNLANAYAMTNDVDLAIKILQQGIIMNSQIAELHNNLGALLLHKQQTNTAIKHLKIALKLKPDFGQSMYTLAKAYLQKGLINLAWILLDKAVHETHMDRIDSTLQLYAKTSIKLQKFNTAIYALKKILAKEPDNTEALKNLAGAYYFTNNTPAAIECYQEISKSKPHNLEITNKLELLKQNF